MLGKTRVERDAIGEVHVPSGAYFGSFTARAMKNFKFGKSEGASELYKSYVLVKLACCRANLRCGMLEKRKADAIERACREALAGKFDSHLVLGFYQAGAGTPFNMNVNEVLANRANEILGGRKGEYGIVHPNNHVNMGQSSNDVTPTAIRLSLLSLSPRLEKAAMGLSKTLSLKARKYRGKIKVGRTHLQDAVPIGIWQEIGAWANSLERDVGRIREATARLREIPLGGTALGTGIASHPKFGAIAAKELSKLCNERLISAKNKPLLISNMNDFLAYSASVRCLAASLAKIANDFKLLVSGPNAGIAELVIPEVEPGSSIMPGKVNPSMPEALEIVALDAIADDSAVLHACLGGQLQLNVLTPLIAKNTIEPAISLANAIEMFDGHCARRLEYDLKRCSAQVNSTYVFATALNPYFGYQVAAELVKESLARRKSVSGLVLEKGLMGRKELQAVLDPEKIAAPAAFDRRLLKKVKSSRAYREYCREIGFSF